MKPNRPHRSVGNTKPFAENEDMKTITYYSVRDACSGRWFDFESPELAEEFLIERKKYAASHGEIPSKGESKPVHVEMCETIEEARSMAAKTIRRNAMGNLSAFEREALALDFNEDGSHMKGGSFFKPDRIKIIPADQVPYDRISRIVRAFGKAAKNAGCYTAGPLLGVQKKDHSRHAFYILDFVRGRWSTDEVEDQIKLWGKIDMSRFGSKYAVRFEQEAGASGPQAAAETISRLQGIPVRAIQPRKNKQASWNVVANSIAAHEFYMVEAPWNKALIEEMRNCLNAEFVSQLDSLALAYDQVLASD